MNVTNEKKSLIKDYITEEECNYMCDSAMFKCESCGNFEECYMKADTKCNIEFAKNVGYGGYNTEEDFWEQL